jgi:hypothetical protein
VLGGAKQCSWDAPGSFGTMGCTAQAKQTASESHMHHCQVMEGQSVPSSAAEAGV